MAENLNDFYSLVEYKNAVGNRAMQVTNLHPGDPLASFRFGGEVPAKYYAYNTTS